MRFLLAALLLFSASLVLEACRLQPNSLVGDVNALDLAAQFNGAGFLQTTSFDVSGSGLSVQFDVFSNNTASGCIFSAGTPGSNGYIEARLITLPTSPSMHALAFTIGTQTIQTFGVIPKQTWAQIAFTVSNSAVGGIFASVVYVNGNPVTQNAKLTTGVVGGARSMMVGKCASDNLGFNGLIDNLRFIATVLALQDVQDANTQFFPMPASEGLIVYYDFNDMTTGATQTVGQIGANSPASIQASLQGGVASMLRQGTAGDRVSNICIKQGLSVAAGNGNMGSPPFLGTGGYAQTILCNPGDQSFILNEQFSASGSITAISIRTSSLHYWRISSGGLNVEHRTWGGWTLLPRGADYLTDDQTTIKFSDSAIIFQVGPFGYIRITEDATQNLNYQVGVDSSVCKQPSAYNGSYCSFHQTQLSTFEFSSFPVPEMPMGVLAQGQGVLGQGVVLACPPPSQAYRPDLIPPPVPVPLSPVPVQPGPDPCANVAPAVLAMYQAACNANFAVGGPRQVCLADSCITANPFEPPKITCDAQKLIQLNDPLFQIDPSCNTVCPNACNNQGNCTNGVCVCQNGFVGADCSAPAIFPCFTVSSPAGNVILRPLYVRSAGTVVTATSFLGNLGTFTAAYRVVDSAVVFAARTRTSDADSTPSYSLVFVNNNGNGNANGGQMTATITGISGAAVLSQQVVGGSAVTSTTNGNTMTISSTWTFAGYSAFAVSGFADPSSLTITVTTTGGLDQVLIGSAHLLQTDSNLATYELPIGTAFSINGGTCNDTCAGIPTCAACAANPACGWCVDSGMCVPGDRTGPWTYGICQNWRYTFDASTSRRLTQNLAFPVNPGSTDVIVTTADSLDLPVEIIVAPRDPTKSQWDLVYVLQYNGNVRAMFTTYIESIINTLTGYPNLGVGFVSAQPGSWDLIRDLSNPRDTFYIPQAIRQEPQSSTGPISVLATLQNLPIAWRVGSSRLALVVADQPYIPNEVPVATVAATLIAAGVVPIFLVPDSVAAVYQGLVNQLQYGLVLTMPFNAQNNIPQASVRALSRAGGYASTFYTAAGIIDTAAWAQYQTSWSMYGLQNSVFARFLIPTKGLPVAGTTATTTLQMPGYGSATVENILSDRPVAFPLVTAYEVKEGQTVLVTLSGRSLNDLFKTLPKVVQLPTLGTLNFVQSVMANGQPTGDIVAGDLIGLNGTTNDLLDRIFYSANANTGGKTDTFVLSVTDTCSDSLAVTYTINIAANNRPPVTEMLPQTLPENTPALIILEASDPNGDLLNLYITQIVHELDAQGNAIFGTSGTLYQYDPSIMTGRPAANNANALSKLINAGDKVADSQGRVIYWPPQNDNSYANATTPWLLIHPCIEYKAKEAATVELFESSPTKVYIDVFFVNQAPYIWEDPDQSYPVNDSHYVWNTPDGVCWNSGADCTWPEDFGQQYPWNTPYKYLYVGGDDIEKSNLDFIIKNIDCDPLANLTLDLTGDVPLKVGDVIQSRLPGVLQPGIAFRPGPDRNNVNGGQGSYYCKISYSARDVFGVQSNSVRVITVSITPVNDKPRIRTQTTLITSVEKIPKEFLIDAYDPEGDPFDIVVVGCSTLQHGQFEVCMDNACTQSLRQTFTCDDIENSASGIKLNKRTQKRQLLPSPQGYIGIFTSFALGVPTDGLNYQSMTLTFPQPTDNGTPPGTGTINFNVIALNNAPVIDVNNNTNNMVTFTLVNGEKWQPAVSVSDIDIGNGDADIQVTFTPNDGSSLTFVDRSTNQVIQSTSIIATTANSVSFHGKLLTLNSLLSGFIFTPKTADSTYTFTITANDNGYSGQCPFGADGLPIPIDRVLYDATSICPMTAKTQVSVSYVDPTQLKTIAIAGSGAAVLVVGLIGAALAVRAFNKHAESAGYKPWDVFHESDAVLSNPLYEEAALGGASGIYEGKSNKDLLGSSSESPNYIGMDKQDATA